MLGASVRNSAHGKGHEEGGLAYAKAWSSLRKPPVPKHLPPKPESFYFIDYAKALDFVDHNKLWKILKEMGIPAGGQREELRPWQRSWGRRLGIRKGVIKPQETPCSRASNPKTRVCFMLSPTPLTLRGALPHNHLSQRRSKRAALRQ